MGRWETCRGNTCNLRLRLRRCIGLVFLCKHLNLFSFFVRLRDSLSLCLYFVSRIEHMSSARFSIFVCTFTCFLKDFFELHVIVCLHVILSLFVCFSVSLSMRIFLPPILGFLLLGFCLCLSLFVCLSVFVCLYVCLSFFVCLCMSFSLFLCSLKSCFS